MMEPTLPNINFSEQTSDGRAGAEPRSAEQLSVASPEQASRPPSLAISQPVRDNQPVAAQPDTAQPAQPMGTTDDQAAPAIADDVDVIEKEWVDRAKKIVNSTKDNPREQKKEVSKLQADYLMKRHGKQVKIAE